MSRTDPHRPGFQRLPRIADLMTSELNACADNAIAAEQSGDVSAALEWHLAVPMFRRSRHRSLLEQLEALGDHLPEWVWARWIAYQVARCEMGSTGERVRPLTRMVAETCHVDLLRECHDSGGDSVQVFARVLGDSWIYHQLAVHEFELTESFLDEFARGRLAEHADLVRTWIGAPMRCYEIGESLPGARLRVRESGGEWLEVLDLGARAAAGPHGWVLGRLVPSGVGDLLMFDTVPLAVAPEVGEQIAGHAQSWLHGVADVLDSGQLPSEAFVRECYELTTDVEELALLAFATKPTDLGRVMVQLREGSDEIRRAAFRVLRKAADGDVAPSDQACVGAAALNVPGLEEARRKLVRPGQDDVWRLWAERCAAPARGRLLSLAEAARRAA